MTTPPNKMTDRDFSVDNLIDRLLEGSIKYKYIFIHHNFQYKISIVFNFRDLFIIIIFIINS